MEARYRIGKWPKGILAKGNNKPFTPTAAQFNIPSVSIRDIFGQHQSKTVSFFFSALKRFKQQFLIDDCNTAVIDGKTMQALYMRIHDLYMKKKRSFPARS